MDLPWIESQIEVFIDKKCFYLCRQAVRSLNTHHLRTEQDLPDFRENRQDPETTRFSKKSLSFLSTDRLITKRAIWSSNGVGIRNFHFFQSSHHSHTPYARSRRLEVTLHPILGYSI